MNKLLLCIAFILLGYLNLHAQKVYNFKLDPPQTKIANSFYNSLSVLDYRGDTTSMGFILEGMMARYAKVKPAAPVSDQFKTLFNSVIDSTASKGKLLLQITRLVFAERENTMNYDAYFNLRANLYSKIGENYQLVSTIDTLVDKRSFSSPDKELLKSANEVMSDFIIKNLLVKSSGQMLTYYDVLHISNIEKNKIALYKTAEYTDGLYLTYQSFKNQMPDRQIIVDSVDLNSGDIRTIEGGGVTKEVKANDIYAIVYRGRPYVASEGHYYALNKMKNDFFFVGKATFFITSDQYLVAAIAGEKTKSLGINLPKATFEIEIDYKSGMFIRLKKIPDGKSAATAQPSGN